MLDNPFGEDVFPNIQSEPPLANVRPLVLSLVTWEKRPTPTSTTASFQVAVARNLGVAG